MASTGITGQKTESLVDRSMKKAKKYVKGDVVLKGQVKSLETVPGMHKVVSKESGLDGAEDGNELSLTSI